MIVEEIWKEGKGGKLNPLAFSEVAKNLAKDISEEGGKKKNRRSQLMKYYDAILKLNERAKIIKEEEKEKDKDKDKDFNTILVQLNRQLALVYYARGRDKVTDKFVKMMEELIKSVENKDDLEVITNFLECFIAFYIAERRKIGD